MLEERYERLSDTAVLSIPILSVLETICVAYSVLVWIHMVEDEASSVTIVFKCII